MKMGNGEFAKETTTRQNNKRPSMGHQHSEKKSAQWVTIAS